MNNQNQTRAEQAFLKALEMPVPQELVDNIRNAARHRSAIRAWRRRAVWVFAPAVAAAVAIAAFFTIPRLLLDEPDAPASQFARPASFHQQAQTLVSLAAGGNEYHEEADVHSLAEDLLSLQGFY